MHVYNVHVSVLKKHLDSPPATLVDISVEYEVESTTEVNSSIRYNGCLGPEDMNGLQSLAYQDAKMLYKNIWDILCLQ